MKMRYTQSPAPVFSSGFSIVEQLVKETVEAARSKAEHLRKERTGPGYHIEREKAHLNHPHV